MPRAVQLPRPARRQLVRSVTQATRTIARRQGTPAARAAQGVVRTVQAAVQQGRIPQRAVPQAITRTATRVASNPQLTRRMVARATTATRAGRVAPRRPVGGRVRAGGVCPTCRRRMPPR